MTAAAARWAVVTGASSGIGRATALALAKDGWDVVVHYRRSQDAAEQVREEILRLGRRSLTFPADFADPAAGPELVRAIWDATGGVDGWAHNAGADTLNGAAAQWPFEKKLEHLARVDLCGTIYTCRSIGERMVAQGRGSIVTMGWDQAATGMEGDSGELFAAVKGGVLAFTRSLAKSLAPTVRVNGVAPGWIRTAWGRGASDRWTDRVMAETPLKRWGEPADVAKTIAFLLSPNAEFLTGQIVSVNGGAVMA